MTMSMSFSARVKGGPFVVSSPEASDGNGDGVAITTDMENDSDAADEAIVLGESTVVTRSRSPAMELSSSNASSLSGQMSMQGFRRDSAGVTAPRPKDRSGKRGFERNSEHRRASPTELNAAWEGVVGCIVDDSVFTSLHDLLDRTAPVIFGTLPRSAFRTQDAAALRSGMIFHWTVGTRRNEKGVFVKFDEIQLFRAGALSPAFQRSAEEEADRIRNNFGIAHPTTHAKHSGE
jgi:hypothetical protein